MKLSISTLICLSCAVASYAAPADPATSSQATAIAPGHYVVLLWHNATDTAVFDHIMSVRSQLNSSNHSGVNDEYHFLNFHAYSLTADLNFVTDLANDTTVELIEEDIEIHVAGDEDYDILSPLDEEPDTYAAGYRRRHGACRTQTNADWGLSRTSQRRLNQDNTYVYDDRAGLGVDIYVIDTGIMLNHLDLQGRAFWGFDAVNKRGRSPKADLNGHGTHIAGTIAGRKYGIAKHSNVIAVRVMDGRGRGKSSYVIDALLWVASTVHRNRRKSVANMSLGGRRSEVLNRAVRILTEMVGVHVVAAAGNDDRDACYVSPASEPSTISVGCSDDQDRFCVFSNYGQCVDIVAPGEDIKSLWIGNPYAVKSLPGTSMSAAHVSGLVARFLSGQQQDLKPWHVKQWLLDTATVGALGDLPPDTVNRLAFMDCI